MPFAVRIVDGRGLGLVFLLGQYTTIGRENVDILLDRRDTQASRLHGVFQCLRDDLVVFTNLGHNGTLIERPDKARIMLATKPRRQASAIVYEGDVVVIGGSSLRVIKFSVDDVVFAPDFPDEAASEHPDATPPVVEEPPLVVVQQSERGVGDPGDA